MAARPARNVVETRINEHIGGINTWILFKEVTGKSITRRDFLLQLATELSNPYVTTRGQRQTTEDDVDDEYVEPAMKRRKCQILYCKGHKTKDSCIKCKTSVCGVCTSCVMTRNVYVKCDNDDVEYDSVTYSLE